MRFRAKLFFLLVVITVVTLLLFTPVLSNSSLSLVFNHWMADYNNAVEIAQGIDDETDELQHDVLEQNLVRIDDEISGYAGIELSRLERIEFIPSSKAMATVIDLQPLLVLRNQYFHKLSLANVAKVAKASAGQELARLSTLAKGAGSIAAKRVNYAQAVFNQTSAQLQLSNNDVLAIKESVLLTWGPTISQWLLTKDSPQWQRLLSHQQSLLLVTVAKEQTITAELTSIRLSGVKGLRQGDAFYLSPATQIDSLFQGQTFFFITDLAGLRAGIRLNSWLPHSEQPLVGVEIPRQAIVWNAGQAWVYSQLEANLYQRHLIDMTLTTGQGVFIESGLKPGQQIVVTGAQMLLSEEFRWQILDEDDD